MSVKVETKERSMATLTIEVTAEEFDKALERAYQKQKKNISIPGFRKGKVPRMIVEKMYGPAVFYEEAANDLINSEYPKADKESGLEIVSRPKIDVVQIEAGKPFIFTADVAVKPPVELGEYKGLEVTKKDRKVTAEDVKKRIENEQKRQVRKTDVTDRAVKDGDEIDLNFDGYVDGKAFKGGKAEGYTLTVGSNTFIPGFEDQLIGVMPGEDKDVVVTFPEDYQEKSLAGKEATFKCKVNKIVEKEYPEIDDEFASEVSECETLAEYKKVVKKQIQEYKDNQADAANRSEAVDLAAENAKIDIPQPMIDMQIEQLAMNFEQQIKQQGMEVEQYLQMLGMTPDQMLAQMEPEAINNIRTRLTLEAIVEKEGIEISDAEMKEDIKKFAEIYNSDADQIIERMSDEEKENHKKELAVQKAADLVGDLAVEVEKKEEPEEKKPAAKKTTAKKSSTTKKTTAAKKPAAKKTTAAKKPAAKKTTAEKKPAAKKTTTAKKTTAAKKPAAKKTADKKEK